MRLFTKYFLFGMLVFGLALSASGYFLLHYSMESSMAREADFALEQYQYDKFTVQSALLSRSDVSLFLDMEGSEPGSVVFPDTMQFFAISKDMLRESGMSGEQDMPGAWDISEKQDTPGAEEMSGKQDMPGAGDMSGGQDVPWSRGEAALTVSGEDLFIKNMFVILAGEISSPVAFLSEDGTPYYSEIEGLDSDFLDGLQEGAHFYQFRGTSDGGSVLVGSVLDYDRLGVTESVWSVAEQGGKTSGTSEAIGFQVKSADAAAGAGRQRGTDRGRTAGEDTDTENDTPVSSRKICFVTQWDITKTVQQQETMRQYFIRCYLAAMAAGMLLMGVLSALLTGPLKRMSKAAGRMAEGCYEERLSIRGKDEIGELAGSFNQMAEAVEEKIGELSRAAREKEDFVANFAHELKTPLTSIIGYADTIYQKELPQDEVRRASWHIWNEGMRLESLSFKLMELVVLGRQDFPLMEMPADELLKDVAEGLAPLMEGHKAALELEAQAAYIKVDYDLLKTLIINLVDNSVKAGSSRIVLKGEILNGKYEITVRDNGCGMEEEVLSRITEAFYMVDKARSRKQHGAGLGLALADRIARIHGTSLRFESRRGEGTVAAFCLDCVEEEGNGDM